MSNAAEAGTPRTERGPLAVIVDDLPRNREQYRRQFSKRGCRTLLAADFNEASSILMGNPDVDLVFTDINLDAKRPNTDGIRLAKFVRGSLSSFIPLVGCTANEDLLDNEDNLFDMKFFKGHLAPKQIGQMYDDCTRLAKVCHSRRMVVPDRELDAMQQRHPNLLVDEPEFARASGIDRATTSSLFELEDEISRAGYTVISIPTEASSALRRPIVAWCRDGSAVGSVVIEVYGQPVLFEEAETLDLAVAELVGSMKSFRGDLAAIKSEREPVGAAAKLIRFLESVLR